MADDDKIRSLFKMIVSNTQNGYDSHFLNSDKLDKLIKKCGITKKCFKIAQFIFNVYCHIVHGRWKTFCEISCLKALSSHVMYFRYVMYACNVENELANNVFHGIFSVCALVFSYNQIVLENTGLDFCYLTVDMFMVFYKHALKKPFRRKGSLKFFEEYIEYEYKALTFRSDSQSEEHLLSSTIKKIDEVKNLPGIKISGLEKITHEEILKEKLYIKLAQKVVSTTKTKLPTLPTSDDLKIKIRTLRVARTSKLENSKTTSVTDLKIKMKEKESKQEALAVTLKHRMAQEESNLGMTQEESNPDITEREFCLQNTERYIKQWEEDDLELDLTGKDSDLERTGEDSDLERTGRYSGLERTGRGSGLERTVRGLTFQASKVLQIYPHFQTVDMIVEDKANMVWCENIVLAVTKFHISNKSNPAEVYNRILKETSQILEHLKSTIGTLLEVLDEVE